MPGGVLCKIVYKISHIIGMTIIAFLAYRYRHWRQGMVVRHSLSQSSGPAAFSLIEVILSLGIVSFTCVTLLGLLPLGLNSFHQAMSNNVESQIVQNLASNMQLASYAQVGSVTSGPYSQPLYFDSDGIARTSASGAIYTVTVKSSTDLSGTPLFSANATLSSGVGTTLLMAITAVSQPSVTNYFPIILANNRQ